MYKIPILDQTVTVLVSRLHCFISSNHCKSNYDDFKIPRGCSQDFSIIFWIERMHNSVVYIVHFWLFKYKYLVTTPTPRTTHVFITANFALGVINANLTLVDESKSLFAVLILHCFDVFCKSWFVGKWVKRYSAPSSDCNEGYIMVEVINWPQAHWPNKV